MINRNSWKIVLSTLFGALLITTVLPINAEEVVEQERVEVGNRPEPEEETPSETNNEEEFPSVSKVQSKRLLAKGTYYSSHTGALHHPYNVSIFGYTVEFEDGSVWSVRPSDAYKMQNWLASDTVIVVPKHSIISSYKFRVVNQNTGVAVDANLFAGPFYNGFASYWITAINWNTDTIYLNDGSVWDMAILDSHIISKWLPNDTVIIGVNDGSLSSIRPNILINVNTLAYARGNCAH